MGLDLEVQALLSEVAEAQGSRLLEHLTAGPAVGSALRGAGEWVVAPGDLRDIEKSERARALLCRFAAGMGGRSVDRSAAAVYRAARWARVAHELEPGSGSRLAVAWSCFERGWCTEALTRLEALAADTRGTVGRDGCASAWVQIGLVRGLLGERRASIAAYERASEVRPAWVAPALGAWVQARRGGGDRGTLGRTSQRVAALLDPADRPASDLRRLPGVRLHGASGSPVDLFWMRV